MKTGFQVGIAALWLGAVLTGMNVLHRSETASPPPRLDMPTWPDASPIARIDGQRTIVMAIHPRCSCTRASLEGLRSFIEASPDPGMVVCLATIPAGADPEWTDGPNCLVARNIPGVTLIPDPEGSISAMHGLGTSGQVAAFDRHGKGYFSGGLTPGRGLAATCTIVSTLLDPSRQGSDATPVFGCALVRPEPGGALP